jgi:hypothetical protein
MRLNEGKKNKKLAGAFLIRSLSFFHALANK